MIVHLAYGKNGLDFELPDNLNITIIEPKYVPGLPNPKQIVTDALHSPIGTIPLREKVKASDKIGIIFSDITRATPHQLLIPPILEELSHVPAQNITLFNALGTHRPNTEAELRGMLGDTLVDRYRIVQNNAFDPSTQVYLGVTARGHEIWLNRELLACDVKILTGFIEPHLFAGFSGGGKAIMPGMIGQRTVLANHGAAMIGDPRATWGVTQGNPILEEIHEIAHLAGHTFLLNVALNRERDISAVFAGDLDAAHAAGCAFVKDATMVAVPRPFDFVITSNSGYPLDLNLYQSVKGMSAAARVVRPGGSILVAAECWDGIPEHGLYARLLREAHSPQDLLERVSSPDFHEQDQWQVQTQALIQLKADIFVYSQNLTDEQIRNALLQPCRRIEDTVETLSKRYGPKISICVLPEGPLTIPYVNTETA